MLLLNIAADDVLLIKSGMLFHKRLLRNFIESMPNVVLFAAGIYNKSLVLRLYLTSFRMKYSRIKGGLVLLSVLYTSIISIRRFWVWIFASPFFASSLVGFNLSVVLIKPVFVSSTPETNYLNTSIIN